MPGLFLQDRKLGWGREVGVFGNAIYLGFRFDYCSRGFGVRSWLVSLAASWVRLSLTTSSVFLGGIERVWVRI